MNAVLDTLKPNALVAIVAITFLAIVGGEALLEIGQPEYAAGVYGLAAAAIAAAIRSLTDSGVPGVPASVVMKMLGETTPAPEYRFPIRVNAMFGLVVIAVLALVGGLATINAGETQLGYAIFGVGIGAVATTLSDLIRPADKEVPASIVAKLAEKG